MLLIDKVIDYAKDDLSIDKLIRSKYKTQWQFIHYGLLASSLIILIASIFAWHFIEWFSIPPMLWAGAMFLWATEYDEEKRKEVVEEYFKEYRLAPQINKYYLQELKVIEFIGFVRRNDIPEPILEKAIEWLKEKRGTSSYSFRSVNIVITFIGSYLAALFAGLFTLINDYEVFESILLTTLPIVIMIAFLIPFLEFSIFKIYHSTENSKMVELISLFENSLIEIQARPCSLMAQAADCQQWGVVSRLALFLNCGR